MCGAPFVIEYVTTKVQPFLQYFPLAWWWWWWVGWYIIGIYVYTYIYYSILCLYTIGLLSDRFGLKLKLMMARTKRPVRTTNIYGRFLFAMYSNTHRFYAKTIIINDSIKMCVFWMTDCQSDCRWLWWFLWKWCIAADRTLSRFVVAVYYCVA